MDDIFITHIIPLVLWLQFLDERREKEEIIRKREESRARCAKGYLEYKRFIENYDGYASKLTARLCPK